MNDVTRIFVDMDGVLADFEGLLRELNTTGDRLKERPGAYASLKPIPGAIEAVRSLIGMGFEVWIASKPATGLPDTYSDKVRWILQYLPELKRRIILTHDKGLLGCERDYLIDDRPHKANCTAFRGMLIHFRCDQSWPQILDYFVNRMRLERFHARTAAERVKLCR
jgi:5'(3')-deoxyribonucleotidase